ncbi:Sugar phosphate transporter domain-containing protein [Plasmodiophora brassicae]
MRPVWKMAVAVLFYITVGVLITFYNKMVLSYRGFKFEITMIFVHSISNCLLSAAYCYAFLRKSSLVTSSRFWPGRITWSIYYRQLLPLGALLGFDITLTNLAFRLSSVALTEVVKSGVPLLVLAAGVAMHQETLSRRKVAVILLLSLGIVLTTFGEFRLRFTAIVAAAGAAVCGAAKLVLLQMLMKGRDHIHPTLSLMYMTSSAVISLLIPLFWFEWSELVHSSWVSSDVILSTLSMLLIGSGLAFLLNMSELIVVQWSSALSLCVAGVFKLIIVIIVSSALFDFRPSIVNVFGCVLSLVGIAGYNWVRYHDARRAAHYEKLNLELTEFDMDDVTPAGSDIGDDDNVFK